MTPAERERRQAAFTSWCVRYALKLADMPDSVRIEVESVTLRRFMDGTHRAMTTAEMQECAARAATRMRLVRYGRIPADPDEAARQLAECRAECGLDATKMRETHTVDDARV